MPLFRKKNADVEARQFDGSKQSALELSLWSGRMVIYKTELAVPNIEGETVAQPGDWIVKEAEGWRVIPDDYFKSAYEIRTA